LLLQDLAVVPLLVVTPLLASGGGDPTTAVITALIQAVMAITAIALFGKFAMEPLFQTVLTKSKSQEATIAISLATILGMSFLTEGLGLSNTLGAFLAGVLLSETSFRHVVETQVSPVRGILVGLFFFSVGFEIDMPLLLSSKVAVVAAIVAGLMVSKNPFATWTCLMWKAFGLFGRSRQKTYGWRFPSALMQWTLPNNDRIVPSRLAPRHALMTLHRINRCCHPPHLTVPILATILIPRQSRARMSRRKRV
jgi:monovalent cation:H+ antiporter-2, CPA2 family